jgi:aminoglycoside/choline kinase family phosphotransferase
VRDLNLKNESTVEKKILANSEIGAKGPLRFESMVGDASSRSYHRVVDSNDSSWVVMEYGDIETSLADEKTPVGTIINDLPFVNVQQAMASAGINVPRIFIEGQGFLVLEDLGCESLFDWMMTSPAESEVLKRYQLAIDELIKIQAISINPNQKFIAVNRRFDVVLLAWEFDHFIEYGMEKIFDDDRSYDRLKNYFHSIAATIAKFSSCLVHRDYHSKNLMLNKTGKIVVIDFQDALIGPVHYDLASLLYDSYVDLKEGTIDQLCRYYFDNADENLTGESYEQFKIELHMVALHRNLKAAGRFIYIFLEKHKPTHMQFVIPTLKKAASHLSVIGALDRLKNELPFDEIAANLPEYEN